VRRADAYLAGVLQRKRKSCRRHRAGDAPGRAVDYSRAERPASHDQAAAGELEEEIGIAGLPLTEIAHFYFDEPAGDGKPAKRFIKMYKVSFNDLPQNLEAGEVSEVRWFTKDEIKDLILNHPQQISEGLNLAYNRGYIEAL